MHYSMTWVADGQMTNAHHTPGVVINNLTSETILVPSCSYKLYVNSMYSIGLGWNWVVDPPGHDSKPSKAAVTPASI